MDHLPPEIVFVTRKWPPAVGGMETWSVRLSEELARLAPVKVIALRGREDGRPPSPFKLLLFPFTFARQFLSRRRAGAILHLGDMALWPLGLLAAPRSRLVISAHGTDVSYPKRGGWRGKAYGAYLRLGARLLPQALVIANSAATQSAAAEAGWKDSRIVPLGTNMIGHVPNGAPDRHLLFAGRLIPLKGLSWFVREVLPLLPDDITLNVAGPQTDPAESAALDHPRVRYLGILDQNALGNACRDALCVVAPNIVPANGTFEGFGLVATEAAAAGGIVIAARCGGLPSALANGDAGLLVEPGDAEAWKAAISDVAEWDLARRAAFIANALATIERGYRWPSVAKATLAAYR